MTRPVSRNNQKTIKLFYNSKQKLLRDTLLKSLGWQSSSKSNCGMKVLINVRLKKTSPLKGIFKKSRRVLNNLADRNKAFSKAVSYLKDYFCNKFELMKDSSDKLQGNRNLLNILTDKTILEEQELFEDRHNHRFGIQKGVQLIAYPRFIEGVLRKSGSTRNRIPLFRRPHDTKTLLLQGVKREKMHLNCTPYPNDDKSKPVLNFRYISIQSENHGMNPLEILTLSDDELNKMVALKPFIIPKADNIQQTSDKLEFKL